MVDHRQYVAWTADPWGGDRDGRDTFAVLKRHGLKLPAEYHMWGRTVGSWDYIYLKAIRDNYPDDYSRVLEWWPLADLQIFRYEEVGKRLTLNEENRAQEN